MPSSTAATSAPDIARFALQVQIPLDKDFLRQLQKLAVYNPSALPVWADNFRWKEEEEAVYFDEREWRSLEIRPTPHRVDLYCIVRGLNKVFDPRYDVNVTMRQLVLRALFEQKDRAPILGLHPETVSRIIQLAVYDQIIW